MNNQQFGKLLREWKQKNLQEELEEGRLSNLLGAGALSIMPLVSAINSAHAAPSKGPAAQTQVQNKKELKDLVGLSDNQKFIVGMYIEHIRESMKAMDTEESIRTVKNLRSVINNKVKINSEAEEMVKDIEKKDPNRYKDLIRIAEEAIKDERGFSIVLVNGLADVKEYRGKKEEDTDSQNKSYGSAAWDAKNQGLEEKKKKSDRCVRIAKRRYQTWPSAYASGAVVKCRQGKIWKGLKEEELNEIIDEELNEVAYEGNMGLEELFIFFEKATPEQVAEFDKLVEEDKEQEALDLVEKVVGVELYREAPGSSGSLEEKKKKKPDFKKEKESGLHGWFSRQGGKGKSKGWVDCNTCRTDKKTGRKTCKTCGRKEGEKRSKYPACRPKPSDCGSSGKGEDWGKKSQKESLQVDQKMLESVIEEVLKTMEIQ